jgi:hypothetical protein
MLNYLRGVDAMARVLRPGPMSISPCYGIHDMIYPKVSHSSHCCLQLQCLKKKENRAPFLCFCTRGEGPWRTVNTHQNSALIFLSRLMLHPKMTKDGKRSHLILPIALLVIFIFSACTSYAFLPGVLRQTATPVNVSRRLDGTRPRPAVPCRGSKASSRNGGADCSAPSA